MQARIVRLPGLFPNNCRRWRLSLKMAFAFASLLAASTRPASFSIKMATINRQTLASFLAVDKNRARFVLVIRGISAVCAKCR